MSDSENPDQPELSDAHHDWVVELSGIDPRAAEAAPAGDGGDQQPGDEAPSGDAGQTAPAEGGYSAPTDDGGSEPVPYTASAPTDEGGGDSPSEPGDGNGGGGGAPGYDYGGGGAPGTGDGGGAPGYDNGDGDGGNGSGAPQAGDDGGLAPYSEPGPADGGGGAPGYDYGDGDGGESGGVGEAGGDPTEAGPDGVPGDIMTPVEGSGGAPDSGDDPYGGTGDDYGGGSGPIAEEDEPVYGDSLTPSTTWEITSLSAISGGEGVTVGGIVFTLKDLQPDGMTYHLSFIGIGLGVGAPVQYKGKSVPISLSKPSATQFTTPPVTHKDFNCFGRVAVKDVALGAGTCEGWGQFAFATNPAQIDIGGIEFGFALSQNAWAGRWICN